MIEINKENIEPIFDSVVPLPPEKIKSFCSIDFLNQPSGPTVPRFLFKFFPNRMQVCKLDGEVRFFSPTDEYVICAAGPYDGGLLMEILDVIHPYILGDLEYKVLLKRLEMNFSRHGVHKSIISLEDEALLIKEGLLSGEPKYEPRDDLDDLSLFGGDLDKEVPLTYTRSEVIEIIKMIRPDIADVQTVIDKLLYKP